VCAFQAQYIFLHHVMLEELLLGDVTIPASANFTDEYKRLRKPQQSDKQSLIDKQFQVGAVCNTIYKLLISWPCKKLGATNSINMKKNDRMGIGCAGARAGAGARVKIKSQ